MKKNILDSFWNGMEEKDDVDFISFKDIKVSYSKFYQIVNGIIYQLMDEGIVRGDAVAIYMSNCIEMIGSIAALVILQCKIIPVYLYEKQENIKNILDKCECKKILCNNISYNGIEKFKYEAVLINITMLSESRKRFLCVANNGFENDFKIAVIGDSFSGTINEYKFTELQKMVNYLILEFELNNHSVLCLNQRINSFLIISEIIAAFAVGAKLIICSEADISNPLKILKIANEHKVSLLFMENKYMQIYMQFKATCNDFFDIDNIKNILIIDNIFKKFDIEKITNIEKQYCFNPNNINMSKSERKSEKLSLIEGVIFDAINTKLQILDLSCLDESEVGKSLSEIGLDSLDYMQLVVWIEEGFGIVFDDDKLGYSDFESCYEMILYIAQMVNAGVENQRLNVK